MKRTKMLMGLVISLVAFMLITPVFGDPYVSTLSISNNGKIWRVPTAAYGVNPNEVTGAVANYYWNDTSTVPAGVVAGPVEIPWTRMQKHNDGITLYFDPQVIQEINVQVLSTSVDVYVGTAVTPISGPGFAWGRTR